jgi:hypothetical protein
MCRSVCVLCEVTKLIFICNADTAMGLSNKALIKLIFICNADTAMHLIVIRP